MKKPLLNLTLVSLLVCFSLSILAVPTVVPDSGTSYNTEGVVIRPFNDLPVKPEPR